MLSTNAARVDFGPAPRDLAGVETSADDHPTALRSKRPAIRRRSRARLRHAVVSLLVTGVAAAATLVFREMAVPVALLGFAAVAAAIVLTRPAPERGTTAPALADAASEAAMLQAAIDAVPEAIIALDPRGLVRAFNHAALRVAPALQVGQPIAVALRKPAVNEAVQRAAIGGTAQTAEFSERVPAERWYRAHVQPAAALAGAGVAMLLTIHDLTAVHRVEQMRADFVANASHELRTPLAALSGFIDTLLGPARDDAAARQRFLEIMQSQARRMARLIEDLLSLSRLEVSPPVDARSRAEIATVLHQVVDALQPLAAERAVEVSIAVPDRPLDVAGDRDELFRLFENLVENALKYGASGKRVKIEVATVDGEVAVAVRDFGMGIPPEHVPRLTERFYRVSAEQSRAEGGTGLGLALVKHILNRHGGRLKIESRLGEGSTFTVSLPLARAAASV